MEQLSSGRESGKDIPEININLKDVPTNTPQAFNEGMIKNIETAQKTLVEYLQTHEKNALDEGSKHSAPEFRKILEGQIKTFIANINVRSAALIAILKQNKNKPIAEQTRIARSSWDALSLELYKNKGVMQVGVPYKLEPFYRAIKEKIDTPMWGLPPERKDDSKTEFAPADTLKNIEAEFRPVIEANYPLVRELLVRYMHSKIPQDSAMKDGIIDGITEQESHEKSKMKLLISLMEGAVQAYDIGKKEKIPSGKIDTNSIAKIVVEFYSDFDNFLQKEAKNYTGEEFAAIKKATDYAKNVDKKKFAKAFAMVSKGDDLQHVAAVFGEDKVLGQLNGKSATDWATDKEKKGFVEPKYLKGLALDQWRKIDIQMPKPEMRRSESPLIKIEKKSPPKK